MIEGLLRVFKQLLLLDYRSFYFLVLGDFGDKKKELMELTGNCCIMSLTVVFIIAQGKIEKNFTILFWFQSGRIFFS